MGKKNNNSIEFDLEDFIINDVNITYPNFAHDGMVEKTIFTERYYAALMKIHYLNRIKFDGTSWWIYDIELQYWSEEQFINSRIWDCICDHFRRKEYIYEEVFNTHFDKIYTEEVLNDMAESKQEKLKKLHPFIIFNKLQVSLHSSQKECMHTDTYLAQIVFDKHFLAKCDPIGYINVFKMEIKKEWHQLEDFKGEEYYKEKPEKIPVMINLAFPTEIFPRSPSYLMTDELDIVIGETSDYDKNELAYIITNICNGNYSRMKQILLGYALALKGTDKAYTFCHTGNGSNGKSILKALLQTAFKPFVLNVASSELIRKAKGSRDKFHSSLRGKRILLVEELDELEVDTDKFKLDCKKLIEDNIFAERNIILDKIKILGGYQHFLETKQKFEEFSTNIINVYEQIEKTIKTAYWDSFQEKLSRETPDYLVIIPLLKDIQNMLFLCIPNRYDIHVEIRENIDIDLIQQMVEHNAIDTNDIIKISKYIIYLIEQYQAKSEDSNTKKWSDALYAELNSTNKLDIFFKHFFKGAFNKLENILIQKSEFESHPLYKLIKKEN